MKDSFITKFISFFSVAHASPKHFGRDCSHNQLCQLDKSTGIVTSGCFWLYEGAFNGQFPCITITVLSYLVCLYVVFLCQWPKIKNNNNNCLKKKQFVLVALHYVNLVHTHPHITKNTATWQLRLLLRAASASMHFNVAIQLHPLIWNQTKSTSSLAITQQCC